MLIENICFLDDNFNNFKLSTFSIQVFSFMVANVTSYDYNDVKSDKREILDKRKVLENRLVVCVR